MDREHLAQIIVMLVLLAAVVRCLPGPADDRLGRGDVGRTVRWDRELASLAGEARRKAATRSRGRDPLISEKRELYARLYEIRDAALADDAEVVIQTRGMPRNEVWPMIYEVYPLRVVGGFYEEGSREDDEVRADADWIVTFELARSSFRVEPAP